ncbi:MAG: hypothetical protein ACRDM7_05230 [Thermoleophilaceae bacterium]
MSHLDRIERLLELQGSHPIERALLEGAIEVYEPHQTATAGCNSTFYVEIEPDLVAFHKPHDGIVPRIARDYGHSLDTPAVCECAAWQLAKSLGEPYDRLVAVTVYRAAGPPDEDPKSWSYGSLALKHEGVSFRGARVTREARDDALAAGFLDALIGNQDRHAGQFRWDDVNGRLGLLDHGFSFPVEGSLCRGAYFQQFRRRKHPQITDAERELLGRLLDDGELFGLAGILEPDRAERLRWRAQRMLDLGVVLLKGVV